MEKKIIKLGSRVIYRSSFGAGNKQEATVNEIVNNNVDVDSVDWEEKNNCYFYLSNGKRCFGTQIDDLADIEVRITFRSEIFITGKSLEEIKKKWQELGIFSNEALDNSANFVDLIWAERVDDNKDVTREFN